FSSVTCGWRNTRPPHPASRSTTRNDRSSRCVFVVRIPPRERPGLPPAPRRLREREGGGGPPPFPRRPGQHLPFRLRSKEQTAVAPGGEEAQVVAGEEHGGPLRPPRPELRGQPLRRGPVQPVERLVQHQEPRTVQERRDQRHLPP